MKLYVTVTSERNSRTAKKGGDEFLEIELSAFGKNVGRLILETQVDGSDGANQYLLKFSPSSASNDDLKRRRQARRHDTQGVTRTAQAKSEKPAHHEHVLVFYFLICEFSRCWH